MTRTERGTVTYGQIRRTIGREAALEQLAEEAAELAQAALKVSRILRGINPTPTHLDDAERALVEELSDVILCAQVAGLIPEQDIMITKLRRWAERLEVRYGKINA